jgi:hypothetical protein
MSDYAQLSGAQHVADAILLAEEIVSVPQDPKVKPRLLIERNDPNITVEALRDLLSDSGKFFERGVPVRLTNDQFCGGNKAQIVSPDLLVMIAHQISRPYISKESPDGSIIEKDARLPLDIARMYLAWQGDWRLPHLRGISSAPMLTEEGLIHSSSGYDLISGMWCESIPDLSGLIPSNPTKEDAECALRIVRDTFKTFCFADAETLFGPDTGSEIINLDLAPGMDESGFLVALLTGVCRPSLPLAPGVLIHAASLSGAGAGKGLLARCICKIAFGKNPHAVTAGQSAEELEKRISAELIEGSPVVFLDNLNNRAFKSDQLASAITEDPARVRVFGKLQMVPINTHAFILLTGNGLTVSEDLARRFIEIKLDPRTENPEARAFSVDILAEVTKRRDELLAACLTIWRWGRLNQNLESGTPLGSFEQWCRWVRDPLFALGCQDPVTRVSEAKQQDSQRQRVSEIFLMWWDKHGDRPTEVKDLNDDLKILIDPQQKSRQYLNTQLQRLAGTRIAGFMLIRNKGGAKWTPVSYTLKKIDRLESHRDHRGHRVSDDSSIPANVHAGTRNYREVEPTLLPASSKTENLPDDPYDPYAFVGQDSECHNPGGWNGQI